MREVTRFLARAALNIMFSLHSLSREEAKEYRDVLLFLLVISYAWLCSLAVMMKGNL